MCADRVLTEGRGLRARRGALALLTAVVVAGCAEEIPQPEAVIRPVRSELAQVAGGVRERSFSGVAEATTMWNGSFKVPGTVESISVVVGDAVAAGATIAQIDAYDYELELHQAVARLHQAEANARNAVANFDRIKELYEDNNATRADYDATLASRSSAREAVTSAEKSAELATRRRDYTTLAAPFAGDVAEVPIEENENVNVGQVVVRMTVGDRKQVSVAIPEAYILDINRGEPVTVEFDALRGRAYEATVDEVGVTSVGMATTFPVTVILADEATDVRSGMAADVNFRFAGEGDAPYIAVPLAAVLEDRQGHYVYVLVDPEGDVATVRRTAVTVGERFGLGDAAGVRIEIAGGLREGDRVVTAGAKRIVDGQTVRLDNS